jgi:hypothetical protein
VKFDLLRSGIVLALFLVGWPVHAQFGSPVPLPETVQPPQRFSTSTEHYEYLYQYHKGGTGHNHESVPKWEGLWSAEQNNSGNKLFLESTDGSPVGPFGGGDNVVVIEGILTPDYEAAFRYRRDLGVDYDRLTSCEPAGMPRWLLEPYVREFVNSPTQSWWTNDLGNDTRRIYINQEHKNIDGTHYAAGDSVGFWVDDMLIVHTVDIYPGDYFRGTPPTSNQFESVEVWRMETLNNGTKRLVNNVTFYDELSLINPVTVVYTFRSRHDLEAAGFRMRHWECASNDNTYLTFDEEGRPSTQYRLPGEEGFVDPRGNDRLRNPDLPPDLVGQSKNPIFNDAVQ